MHAPSMCIRVCVYPCMSIRAPIGCRRLTVQHALYSMPYTACPIQHALYSMPYTACPIQHDWIQTWRVLAKAPVQPSPYIVLCQTCHADSEPAHQRISGSVDQWMARVTLPNRRGTSNVRLCTRHDFLTFYCFRRVDEICCTSAFPQPNKAVASEIQPREYNQSSDCTTQAL